MLLGKYLKVPELLYFEPYAVLPENLITQPCAIEDAKKKVPGIYGAELATHMCLINDALGKALKPDLSILSGKCKDHQLADSLGEISRQELKQMLALLEQPEPAATNIYCGRNQLNLVSSKYNC